MTIKHERLCKALDCSFRDAALLDLALRHRSSAGLSNERLEFLGDSILNFVIAERLYALYPDAKEGDLSRLRANLVNGETLAELAKEFELGQHLQLGTGEHKSGGFRRSSILADAMEAIMGAIYLDAGFEPVQKRIVTWYESRLSTLSLKGYKDPKTLLQEHLQASRLELPVYEVVSTEGAQHAQTFTVECTVPGLSHKAKGRGQTRRKAEQEAAQDFLAQLKARTRKHTAS